MRKKKLNVHSEKNISTAEVGAAASSELKTSFSNEEGAQMRVTRRKMQSIS